MFALQYLTRGQANPQGKPRVYFCCHPREQSVFLGPVSKELLAKQNCAIWYPEDPTGERDADFWASLSQMQLFVMPVTTLLLTTKNPAMEEFRFAIQNHIPVLPLMQEGGLVELFNKTCGDLQYLDKYQQDATAIPYDEKLEKYLSAILVSDELAKKVRAAFDAYVFLSYRKKDRRHAQELMRLIHQNAFCRDIAIWYDEYLTPGENFNDAIREALAKSHLFALTVTPSLLEKMPDEDGKMVDNYIIAHEYPMAKESGKPILPVEMQPTDRSDLEARYDGIPLCTDGHDAPSLSRALLEHLRQLALQANDDDPMHNYLIGLAYLNGIDVEVDHGRALALIEAAARSGLVEAVTQLVELYRTGFGVARNYETAIRWQEAKIDLLKKRYEEAPCEESLNELFWSTITCGDYWEELGKLQQAKARYTAARQDIASFPNATLSMRRNSSVSCDRLGDICSAEGDLAAARGYYERSLAIFETLAEETATVEARRDLSVSCDKLGNICNAECDLAAARGYYERSLAIREALAEETGTVEARRDLSISCVHLGNICRAEGDLAAARGYCERSLAISEALAEETATVEARRDLSVSCNRLGDICRAEGDLAAARGYYERSLVIDEALAEETGTVEARRDLSISCDNLGNICRAEGDLAAAKGYYERSLAIFETLAEETATVDARRDLSVSCGKLGDICSAEGDLAAARGYYERSLTIREALAEETSTAEARRDLSNSCIKLGDICRAEGDLAAARGYYERSLAISEALAEETATVEARRDLSISCNRLGDICRAEGDLAAARGYCERSLAISEALAEETGTVEARRDLSISCNKLGDICRAEGDLAAARGYYERSLAISEALAEKTGTIEAWDDLAVSYYCLAQVDEGSRSRYLQRAAEIYERLLRVSPQNVRFQKNLAIIQNAL